jgi:hypothetical protein
MKILFIDDDIENVKNIAKKISSKRRNKDAFYLYLINEESDIILEKYSEELAQLGFKREYCEGFELSEFKKLQEKVLESLDDIDVFIVDRQFEITEPNKTGIDILKYCDQQAEKFFFYILLTKEAKTEGIGFDDLKDKLCINPKNYIDNVENTNAKLTEELEGRLNYFEKNLFLNDIFENHIKVLEKINEDKKLTEEIKANLDYAFLLLKLEFDNFALKDVQRTFGMIIYWYHLSLEMFCEKGKSVEEIIENYNANLENAKNLIERIKGYKPLKKRDPDDKEYKPPTSLDKFIAYSTGKELKYADKLNMYRNNSVHPKIKFIPTLSNAIFASLTFALYVLDEKEISFQRISERIQKEEDPGKKDLTDLLKLFN